MFATNEKCLLWNQRLVSIGAKITKLDDLFAFRFYSWHINERAEDNTLEFDKCIFFLFTFKYSFCYYFF